MSDAFRDLQHKLALNDLQHKVDILKLRKDGLEFEIRALSVLLDSKQFRLSSIETRLAELIAKLKEQNNV